MAEDSNSPDSSPSTESPSPPPPSSNDSPGSNSSPPSGSSSSSSPPPSPPSDNNDDSSNNGNSSPSPPPPDSSSSSPPPPSEQSPPPPGDGEGGEGGAGDSPSPPPPAEQWSPPSLPDNGTRDVPSPPGARPSPIAPPRSSNQSSSSLPDNKSLSPADGGSPPSSSSSSGHIAVIAAGVGIGVVLILLVIICVLCSKKKKKKGGGNGMPPYGWESTPNPQGNQYWQSSPHDHAVKMPPTTGGWRRSGNDESGPPSGGHMESSLAPSPSLTLGFNKSTFSYEELAAATKGFDKSNMLGQGGFGFVHKGVLPNGKEIAVKSLKSGSGQGEREFSAEVEIISRVHHRHLVSLVGYCIAGGQRMLVYEFVPNDTLEHHLHKKGDPTLDFSTRLRVALGSAKGLGYLHEDCHPRIIHRDIKASNILLDENFEAMVADFGLAKLTTDTNTHVSTRVMGTFGYLAPEYASSGKLTEKSDVFSFGVMLLELVTGRRPVDPNMKYMEDSLVDWSRPLLAKALETWNYDELADPRLERNYNPEEMRRMVACAAASIRHSAKRRPKMSQIVRALEGDVSLEDLNEGTKPGQTFSSPDAGSSDYDARAYSADLKKFRQMAFATQDFASSEYGGTTSEYGLNPSTSSSDNSREITK